jgi:ABC-type nitrate/sulfonate/bicarbonate transport system ATPase subunit
MKKTVYVVLLISLVSCTSSVTIPADIIPRKKMETILWQLIQSDEYTTFIITKDSSKNAINERIKLYQEVFALNKTTKEQFRESYQFYLGHPEIAKVMFDSIAARGNRQKADAYRPKVIK